MMKRIKLCIYLFFFLSICCNAQVSFSFKRDTLISSEIDLVLIADYNQDSVNELITFATSQKYEEDSSFIFVYKTRKTHGFELVQAVNMHTPWRPRYYTQGDFNRDGLKDIVVSLTNEIRIYFQAAGGYLDTNYIAWNNGYLTYGLDCGDMNNDGLDDLVLSNNKEEVWVLNQNEDGTFFVDEYAKLTSGLCALKIVDINNDGQKDLLLSSTWPMPREGGGVHDYFSFAIYFQDSTTQKLQEPRYYAAGVGQNFVFSTAVVDFNNDGLLDIATTQSQVLQIRLQDPDNPNMFGNPLNVKQVYNARFLDVADLNKDGKPELVHSASTITDGVQLFEIGTDAEIETIGKYTLFKNDLPNQQAFSIGDINNDGWLDIASVWCYWSDPKIGAIDYLQNKSFSMGLNEVGTFSPPDITIVPNPNNGAFVINGTLPEQFEVMVYNNLGQLSYHVVNSSESILLLSDTRLSNGLYHLVIRDHNGLLSQTKFILNTP
jgi:hypothetical protein